MQMAYYSYSRSDASITALDVLVNGIVIDSIAVDSDKGTGAIDLPVLEGDELCVVNSGAGQTIQDCIVVIAFSDSIPFDPVTPLYELTLRIFYEISVPSYAKYIDGTPRSYKATGFDYEKLGSLAWNIAAEIAQGAKNEGA
jgi:hypothetical protein